MLTDHTRQAALSHRFAEVALGSHAAFAALYDEIAPMVHGIATRAARSPEQANAITANVFAFLWRHAARFDAGTDVCRVAAAIAARATRDEDHDSPTVVAAAGGLRAPTVSGNSSASSVPAVAGHDGHHTLICFFGEHDVYNRDAIGELIDDAIAFDETDVVIDLSRVQFMSSATVHLITDTRERLRRQSRSLTLVAPPPIVARLLDLCGVAAQVE